MTSHLRLLLSGDGKPWHTLLRPPNDVTAFDLSEDGVLYFPLTLGEVIADIDIAVIDARCACGAVVVDAQ